MQGKEPSRPSWGFFIFLSAVLCLILGVQLLNEHFLRGWDAYYYAQKADSWLRFGRLAAEDGNFLHLFLFPFRALGINAQNAWQCAQALGMFLFLTTFSLVLSKVRNVRARWGFFAWAALSAVLWYTQIQFPKTFACLICLNLVFYYTLNGTKISAAWFIWAAAAILLHRMAFPFVGVCALGLWQTHKKTISFKKFICFLFAGTLFIFLWQYFSPSAFSALDAHRIHTANLTPGILSLVSRFALPKAVQGELICAFLWLAFWCWTYRTKGKRLTLAFLLPLCAFIPALAEEPFGIGERFGLLLPYFTVLFCIWTSDLNATSESKTLSAKGKALFCAVILFAGVFRTQYALPPLDTPLYTCFARWTETLKDNPPKMLIASKRFHYFYQFHGAGKSFSFEPEEHWDKKQIWRLFIGADKNEIFPLLSQNCQKLIRPLTAANHEAKPNVCQPAVLIREDCYLQLKTQILRDNLCPLCFLVQNNSWNPHLKRPSFLYKNHAHETGDFTAMPVTHNTKTQSE